MNKTEAGDEIDLYKLILFVSGKWIIGFGFTGFAYCFRLFDGFEFKIAKTPLHISDIH